MVEDIRPPRPKKLNTKKREPENEEPEFIPPDQIKDSEPDLLFEEKYPEADLEAGDDGEPRQWPHPIKALHQRWQELSGRGKIIVIALLMVASAGLSQAVIALWPINEPPIPEPIVAKVEPPEPEPTTEPSKLTGLQVGFEVNKRPVIGVMIENSPDARPQSGLDDAGVVYEAIAEGGITRFMALFLDKTPGYVGPVRSARPYYIRWLLPYDAPYAHVGGSAVALKDIRNLDVKDLDQFHNPGPYKRVSSRYAPHNMYTSIGKLLERAASKGWKKSDFTGFVRKEENQAEKFNATTIDLSISSSLYDVQYKYDKETNSYKRWMGGRKHTDERSGKQITPKIVIALVTDYGIANDGVHSTYRTIGTGKIYVFQNGRVAGGKWKKEGNNSRLKLLTNDGKEMALIPGQAWITVVAGSDRVSYK
jgi:hypothetical protein